METTTIDGKTLSHNSWSVESAVFKRDRNSKEYGMPVQEPERAKFYVECSGWPRKHIGKLQVLVDTSKQISRQTFMRHVDKTEMYDIEQQCGYCRWPSQGMRMTEDHHVTYHKGKVFGKTAYFFSWSSIEFVFLVS